MNKKLALKSMILFGLTIGVLAGCGAEDGKNGTPEKTSDIVVEKGKEQDKGIPNGIVAGEMVPSLHDLGGGKFEYKVKNQTGKEMKLEFTSGQRFDYEIKDKDGKQLYLFSSTASFMQALGEENLKQGEELVYSFNLTEAKLIKDGYTLEVWLTPKEGKKYQTSISYQVK